MNAGKKRRLKAAGWAVGDAADFLGLTEAEAAFVDLKARLAMAFAERRKKTLTQVEAAKLLRSSQSRVAKMEAGDPSVSVDLLVRSLLVLGASEHDLAGAISGRRRAAPRRAREPREEQQRGRR